MKKTLLASSDRDALFDYSPSMGTSSPPPDSTSFDQRQRLLKGTEMLSDGQRRLEDSHRVALETEDLGASILRDLVSQRQQIEGTRDTVRSKL
jgi:vesicle transport through interaction with t-SNAREs 1